MIRITLIHPRAALRAHLRAILDAEDDIEVVSELPDATTLRNAASRANSALIVMGLPAKTENGSQSPQLHSIPKVVLAPAKEAIDAVRLLRSGALGYLATESAEDSLVDAVRSVHAGHHYICPRLMRALAPTPAGDNAPGARLERLTTRERLIFRLLASGLSTRQIANNLGLSRKTVSTHRAHVLVKLDKRNNAELTRFAAACSTVEQ